MESIVLKKALGGEDSVRISLWLTRIGVDTNYNRASALGTTFPLARCEQSRPPSPGLAGVAELMRESRAQRYMS